MPLKSTPNMNDIDDSAQPGIGDKVEAIDAVAQPTAFGLLMVGPPLAPPPPRSRPPIGGNPTLPTSESSAGKAQGLPGKMVVG